MYGGIKSTHSFKKSDGNYITSFSFNNECDTLVSGDKNGKLSISVWDRV